MSPQEKGPNDLLTTRELMDYLQVSRTKVWELVTKQGLPAFKLGGDYRYRRHEVDQWLETRRSTPKPLSEKKQGNDPE
jgi:excisionase family DNA binding protein